jgi:hypothetical protein
MPTVINAGDSAMFTVIFNSIGSGIRNAIITINNNDTSKAAYDFAIQAILSTVKINIKGNNQSIADGDITPSLSDSTDYGIVANGTQRNYKIFNSGTDTLKIISSSVTGTHATDFTISGMPTKINAGDSAMFTVAFNSSGSGIRSASITINNNDTSKAAYDFAIQAILSTVNIDIKGNNLSIADGDITPSLSDSTDFGIVDNGTKRSYKIFNTGTDTLKISSSSITGTHASDFTISGMPTIINAGDSAMFTVTFNTSNSGVRNATITINSNDTSKPAYTFAISASANNLNVENFNLLLGDIKVYPNPVNDLLNIELTSATAQVSIIDALGKVVFSKTIYQNATLNLKELVAGMYTINFITETAIKNIKLIKQ